MKKMDLGLSVATFTASIWTGFFLLAAIFFVGGMFFIAYLSSFKFRVTIKQVLKGGSILRTEDKAREVTVDGVKFWKLRKSGDLLAIPPDEVIELGKKGKKFVEVFKTATGEYVYIAGAPKEDELTGQKIIRVDQPFTTNQRHILIQRTIKAYARKKLAWQDYIIPVTSAVALCMILFMAFAFYGKITEPSIELGNINLEAIKELRGAVVNMNLACRGQPPTIEEIKPVEVKNEVSAAPGIMDMIPIGGN